MSQIVQRQLQGKPLTVAKIESLNHDGRGVAHVAGKAVFIEGALPGEEVGFTYLRRRRHYDTARVGTIFKASPERVDPRCPVFGICGGCSLQHLDPQAQLRAKQGVLLDNLRRIGKVAPETVLPPLMGPVWGYRRKARLGVRNVPKKGGVLVGFREKAKSYIADMTCCEVLDPHIARLLPLLRELIAALSHSDRIPQIEAAAGDETRALVFRHLVELTADDLRQLREFGREHQVQIYLQAGGPETVHALWPEGGAALSYRLPRHGLEICFGPTDFLQVNGEINRQMVDLVLELLEPGGKESVLDLFCGAGNLTLPLAKRAERVLGIEVEPLLVERARANADHNGIGNTTFLRRNLYDEQPEGGWWQQAYDKILLDPPRTGAIEIVKRIADLGAGRVVYISCNPATLARDAEVMVHVHGYRLLAAGVMDMFPHTAHVESIAVFVKA